LSGFFSALLFYERSAKKMIQNRLKRVVYPFIVFWVVLWPFILFAWIFTGQSISGSKIALHVVLNTLSNPLVYYPLNTFHLRFLNYLIYFIIFSWILALGMKKHTVLSAFIKNSFESIFSYPLLSPFVFSLFTCLFFYLLNVEDIYHNILFIPDGKPLFVLLFLGLGTVYGKRTFK
jgi:glucan biosynthesis protein C